MLDRVLWCYLLLRRLVPRPAFPQHHERRRANSSNDRQRCTRISGLGVGFAKDLRSIDLGVILDHQWMIVPSPRSL